MLKKFIRLIRDFRNLCLKIDYIQQSLGRIESRQLFPNTYFEPNDCEFKVYSQSGEDGIIQWIINNIDIPDKTFIEFGVEDFLESNMRFLALNNYWSGLVIDGDEENIKFIKNDPFYWRCNIKAHHSFITKDNVNQIFRDNGISGNIGILSVDIDGNDYWVLNEINSVNPAVIIAEYNSFFGPTKKVTVPYDPHFVRSEAHFSKIYYGASINALVSLVSTRGYKLVASNLSGNNIFFVRNDLINDTIKEISVEAAYRQIRFREAHNEQGQLVFKDFSEAKKIIEDLLVFNIETNALIPIKDI